jgi:hypothetical protein
MIQLINTCTSTSEDKYNWASTLRDVLLKGGKPELLRATSHFQVLEHKNEILNQYNQGLDELDLQRALISSKHSYCTDITEETALIKLCDIFLHKIRLIAQVRLNNNKFFFKKQQVTLNDDRICSICNFETEEDMFHFLFECKIHDSSRKLLLRTFLNDLTLSRNNFKNKILLLSRDENIKLANYVISCILRRNLFMNLVGE